MSCLSLSPLLCLFSWRLSTAQTLGMAPERRCVKPWDVWKLCLNIGLTLQNVERASSCLPDLTVLWFFYWLLVFCVGIPDPEFLPAVLLHPLHVFLYQYSLISALSTCQGSFIFCCWLWSWPDGLSSLCLPKVRKYGDNTVGVQITWAWIYIMA